MKLDNVDIKLQTLIPYKRLKRGLINGLGTIIKTIRGNIIAQDAELIKSQINNLTTYMTKLTKRNNIL